MADQVAAKQHGAYADGYLVDLNKALPSVFPPGTYAPVFFVTVDPTRPLQVQGVAGATSDVSLHDAAAPGQHLAIDGAGHIGINNFPADQLVHAANLDLALTALRDAIVRTGATAKTLADLDTDLATLDTDVRAATTAAGTNAGQAHNDASTLHTDLAAANSVLGSAADNAVAGDNPGSIKAALRYLSKVFASVWNAAAGRLQVSGDPTVTLPVSVGNFPPEPPVTLTSRLMPPKPQPQVGYQVWLDTSDAAYIYSLEAPAGTLASATGFEGIRIPIDTTGNVNGEVQVNAGATLTWNNRKTDGGWA